LIETGATPAAVIARESSDEAIQTRLTELSLDYFVAALPRNDEVSTRLRRMQPFLHCRVVDPQTSKAGEAMSILLIIIILILLFGGGGGYYAHRSYGGAGLGGVLGLVLIVIVVIWLVNRASIGI
jgi:hypothetical protein